MAAFADDYTLEGNLERIAEGTRLFLCNDLPTTYAEASADMMLAQATLTPGDGNGDFAIADGASSGRKVTLEGRQIASASASGSATHYAICDNANSRVLWAKELSSQISVTSGNPVDIEDIVITTPDPA